VMIGLRENVSEAAVRAYDRERAFARWDVYRRRYGMPFALEPKERPSGTGRGCRAVIAAGMLEQGSEWRIFRTLQLANFTSSLYLDDVESIRNALLEVPGVDANAIAARVDDADVVAEYERQRTEARSAAGTPAEAQGKTASFDGEVRFTAPSVVFRNADQVLVAGGWQPLLSYDTMLANLEPRLERVEAPDHPEPVLEYFREGLTTAEVAQLLADGSDPIPDVAAAASALDALVAQRKASKTPLGTDALWRPLSV
jgi:2-hydroxychromene-2-carboxylate isomerase